MESNFVVSARKYRPQTFSEVVGQQSITETLENSIAKNKLAQAYLFCGPRGVGKTSCARIFAKHINREIEQEDQDFSFNIFELDAASNNSVEDIRSITDSVKIPPQTGKYKVYIVDEVHMLSQAAFNAFLKTLEEPPPHAIFVLATTEKHKIIPTILSRCQIFDFKRIGTQDIVSSLEHIAEKEGIQTEKDGLHVIAQKADGAMRDALSIFDQLVSFTQGNVSYQSVISSLNVLDHEYYLKLVDNMLSGDIPSALTTYSDILEKGFDGHHFIVGLSQHFRNLLVAKDEVTLKLLEVGEGAVEHYKNQCAKTSLHFLIQALNITGDADIHYKASKNQRLHVELALMKLCSLNSEEAKKKMMN